MAIGTKKKRVLAAKEKDFPQATTHFPNETTKAVEESGQSVKNQQDPQDLLIDPDDESGSTHFRNEQEYNDKSKANPVSAKAADRLKSKVKADAEPVVEEDTFEGTGYTQEGLEGEDPNATFDTSDSDNGLKASADCEDGPQATTHFPNGEEMEPTDGYLTVGELEDYEDEEFEDEEEVNADSLDEDAGQAPQQSLLDVTDEHEIDAEFEDDFEEEPEGEPEEVEDEAIEEEVANVDEMSVLDVDGTDDEGDDVVFASIGTQLKVIKANRIIASMGKKVAAKAGVEDVYLSEQFQDASIAEFSKHGLRAGLKKMGFVLAKINVGKSEVVNKRVEAKVKIKAAAVRRTTQAANDALGQSLAIAAVGINRQYFKDTRNELRAALEAELEAAGVRGATKLVRAVFASKGVDYAKAILTLANKLVNMPEETRNAFAAALDLTTDGEIEEDEDTFGDSAAPDFQAEASEDDAEWADEFDEELEAPETIHAALSRPIARREVTAKSAGYSVSAMAILNGKQKLPFA